MNGILQLAIIVLAATGLVEPAWVANTGNTVEDLPEDQAEDTSVVEPDEKAPEELLIVGARIRNQDSVGIHMDAEALKGIPGVNDDPLSALPTLPGVAVNNDFEGGAAIRGTRPVDNSYRVDFLDVGYLFHFGTGSVVDGDLVQGFTFHGAGYGPRFQNVIGGVVDVVTRNPSKDDVHGMLDVNLVHGGLLGEGPLADDKRAYFSTRASYYHLVLEPFLEGVNDNQTDDVDVVQLPRFWDYRSRYQVDVGKWSRIDVLFDGAMDEVELLFHDETTEARQDPVLAGAHRFGLRYQRQGFVYSREPPGDRWTVRLGASRNDTGFSARLGGAGDVDTRVTDNVLRLEVQGPSFESHRLEWGLTLSLADVKYDVLLRDAGCTEFEVVCRFSDADPIMAADKLPIRRLNAFVEDTWSLTGSAKVFATGKRWLEQDIVDAVVVAGADSLCLSVIQGFHSLQLVSSEPCQPFASNRSGISIGEAAGLVLMTRERSARSLRLLGVGESCDAFHMSSAPEDGVGARLAMGRALEDAGLRMHEIDYVNLHGTGTRSNDDVEGRVCGAMMADRTVASATKGWTGHALGAAGIVEGILCLESLASGLVPGTRNTIDHDAPFDLALQNEQHLISTALTNSFGFGGNNCSVVFGR